MPGTPNYYETVYVGSAGHLRRFKVVDADGVYVPGGMFANEREAVDFINRANGWGADLPQAESDPELPIRAFVNVSEYGTFEIHPQLATNTGLYHDKEGGTITLALSRTDAQTLRAQLDELVS